MNRQNGNNQLTDGQRKLLAILRTPKRGDDDHLSKEEFEAMTQPGVDTRSPKFITNSTHVYQCKICRKAAIQLGTFSDEFFADENEDDD